MTPWRTQAPDPELWALTRRQHGVVTHAQLVALGFSRDAIRHRLATGRLHRLWPGVYAVGRPDVSQEGLWLAAVLTCGPGAFLSHLSAAALWKMLSPDGGPIHVTVPSSRAPRRRGIVVHRSSTMSPADVVTEAGIAASSPVATLIDLARALNRDEMAQAVREADKLELVDLDELRAAVDGDGRQRPGAAPLRRLLDTSTFALTDSVLERRFLALAKRAGLAGPETQVVVNGHRVDFLFRDLGLVVETDGLRYHRTPLQQAEDRLRDQAHTAAGLTTLRFTHAQVTRSQDHVVRTLQRVAMTLRNRSLNDSGSPDYKKSSETAA